MTYRVDNLPSNRAIDIWVNKSLYGIQVISKRGTEAIDIRLTKYTPSFANKYAYIVKTVEGIWVAEKALRDTDVRIICISKGNSVTPKTKAEEMARILMGENQ